MEYGKATPRAWEAQTKGVQEQKEQKQEKAVTNQRQGWMFLFGNSVVRHVGMNLQRQCAGLNIASKNRADGLRDWEEIWYKDDKVIVQVGTNNLRMEVTDEMMTNYDEMMLRLKEERQREVVVMGILPLQGKT